MLIRFIVYWVAYNTILCSNVSLVNPASELLEENKTLMKSAKRLKRTPPLLYNALLTDHYDIGTDYDNIGINYYDLGTDNYVLGRQDCGDITVPNNSSLGINMFFGSVTDSLEPNYTFTSYIPLSFPFSLEDCAQESYVDIKGFEGSVYITEIGDDAVINATDLSCQWRISVPEGNIIEIKFTNYEHFTCLDALVVLYYFIEEIRTEEYFHCAYIMYPVQLTRSNTIFLKFQTLKMPPRRVLFCKFYFKAVPTWASMKLPVTLTSILSGYVTTPYYDGQTPYYSQTDASADLIISSGHSIMISFLHLQIDDFLGYEEESFKSTLTLYILLNGETTKLWTLWGVHHIPIQIYNSSIRLHFISVMNANIGFKMLFSIHTATIVPRTLPSGLYDCSVADQYSNFKRHLECNLQRECENGEDEVKCEFSHPGCNGSIGFQDRCYVLITWYKKLSWDHANKECHHKGGKLVTLNTPGKLSAFQKIFEFGKRREKMYVGLEFTEDRTLLLMYRYFWRWRDKTLAYNYNISSYWFGGKETLTDLSRLCAVFYPGFPSMLFAVTCNEAITYSFVCEFKTRNGATLKEIKRLTDVMFPERVKPFFSVNMSKCINGHVTYDFLHCDPDSHCEIGHIRGYCEIIHGVQISNYVCDNGDTLPFTLVCDFREDCRDGSDEQFCRHSLDCNGTKCRNSQCIKSHNVCDGKQHCIDASDEFDCNATHWFKTSVHIYQRSMPSAIIDFDGLGDFTLKSKILSDPCPETHFRCFDGYCMPVYVRCNGVYDCTDHEDESECQRYTCPGFYRCRASIVCVHADHMCDGWAQCPQMDDEWACERNLSCPDVCHCLGLAFVCTLPFSAHVHTDLRYLDAHGSGISPSDLMDMPFLIHLNLSACGLEALPNMTFPNLRVLDLSDNGIRFLHVDIFMKLANLRFLHLARNPLSFIINNVVNRLQYNLFYVDLSGTYFPEFNSQIFSGFPHLKTLILSNVSLTTITSAGFNYSLNLEQLDLRWNLIESFHSNLFQGLSKLRHISADIYRLCCKDLLPEHFNSKFCFAPPDLITSCDDLLSLDVHKWYLWALAFLSVLGNVGCVVFRVWLEKGLHRRSLDLFLTNLNVANAFTGIYLFIIILADISFRGVYFSHEKLWKTSFIYKLAQFLFTMSTEVSVFILCLVTLERIIALNSSVTFQRRSAVLVCVFVWLLSVVIAIIPLVEVTSYQTLSSLSGICIPLFFNNSTHTSKRHLSFFNNVMFVNFLLICLTSVGAARIYLSLRERVLMIDMTTTSREKIATRRLISMAIFNTVSWLAVGLVGIAYFSGTPIPGEVNIGISIFVVPLSAALNPFLYTYSILKERREKREEERIMKMIRSRSVTKKYEAVTRVTTVTV